MSTARPFWVLVAAVLFVGSGCNETTLASLQPELRLGTTVVDFGAVPVGMQAGQSVTLFNDGDAPGPVSVRWSEMEPEAFALLGPDADFIEAFSDVAFELRFSPTARGDFTATLEVGPEVGQIIVRGEGSGEPRPRVDLLSVDFGDVLTGQPERRVVNLSNVGNVALTLTGVEASGDEFAAEHDAALKLAPGASTEIALSYTPVDAGEDTGLAVLSTEASDGGGERDRLEVNLTGRSLPEIGSEPATLDFGVLQFGASRVLPLALLNQGRAALDISEIRLEEGTAPTFALSLLPELPQQLAPGARKDAALELSYRPGERPAGSPPETGALLIASNDPDTPLLRIPIVGDCLCVRPVPEIVLSPDAHDFGAHLFDESSEAEFTVRNEGIVDLAIQSIEIEPDDVGHFVIVDAPAPGEVIAPGAESVITVRYQPTQSAAHEAELVIKSNDPDDPRVFATLRGACDCVPPEPNIEVSPMALHFGPQLQDSETLLAVTLRNTGGSDLRLGAARLGADAPISFAIDAAPADGEIVPPGESREVRIRYRPGPRPDATLADEGLLELPSDDPDTPLVILPLTGSCPECQGLDPGCDEAHPRRLFPIAADVPTCSDAGGNQLVTTGPSAAWWFSFGGCGFWREFDTTGISSMRVFAHSDCCGGCVLWHINYDLLEDTGAGLSVQSQVDGPDERCGSHTEVYAPQTSRVRMQATPGSLTGQLGFYFTVCGG